MTGNVPETGSTGYVEVEEGGKFLIALSPIPGTYRNNFTIAHEPGHYFLHSRLGEKPSKSWATNSTRRPPMRFPESISREEYEKITQRSLRLFLSVDIVNSTALKQEYREKGQSWLELAREINLPFPPRKIDARFPVPTDYKAQELEKLAEFGREFLSESGIASDDGTDPGEDVFTDFTSRLKSPKENA